MIRLPSMSGGVKTAVYAGAVLLVCGTVTAIYPQIWWIMLLGLAVVALMLLSFKLVLALRDRKRGKQVNAKVKLAARGSGGVTDAASQAALDDLQKKFSTGVETLESLGLDLYALPWFVIVGQPASGKTEAIRRCRIPFPPGLTDELQGTGGTVNMDWWFTNDAVILDTAGKMLFQEVGQGDSEEWVQFLKLMRDARPNCPINGMMLVIPADSLIGDSPEKVDQNAKTIARQLNLIQRTLGIRFPVFVLITKCDLVTGFREFFDTLDERRHQQMLGWSNPDPLDTPFDPAKVDEHLRKVRARLEQRRFALLQDPVSTKGVQDSRLDEVDRMFDFPAALEGLSENLRTYLEVIFTGSKLAPKPLFLRGIYFTSSIQKGSILDGVLAQAMGVPLEQLTDARPFERNRPLFLRDLFMEKIFPESGLVTRADNTHKLKAKRRRLVLGTAAIGAVFLIGLSWLGFRGFQKSIGDQGEAWRAIADVMESDDPPLLVDESTAGSGVYQYLGASPVDERIGVDARDAVPVKTYELAQRPIDVPTVFRLVSGLSGDLLQGQRERAHREVLRRWVLTPLIRQAAVRLAALPAADGSSEQVLCLLLRLRTIAAGREPAGPLPAPPGVAPDGVASEARIEPLLRVVLTAEDQQEQVDDRSTRIRDLQAVIDTTVSGMDLAGRQAFAAAILDDVMRAVDVKQRPAGDADQKLVALLRQYLDRESASDALQDRRPLQLVRELTASLRAIDSANKAFLAFNRDYAAEASAGGGTVDVDAALDIWAESWRDNDDRSEQPTGFDHAQAGVKQLLIELGNAGYDFNEPGRAAAIYERAEQDELSYFEAMIAPLRDQLPVRSVTAPAVEGTPAEALQRDEVFAPLHEELTRRIAQRKDELSGRSGEEAQAFTALSRRYLDRTDDMRDRAGSATDRPYTLLGGMYRVASEEQPPSPDADSGVPLGGLVPGVAAVDAWEQESVRDTLAILGKVNDYEVDADNQDFASSIAACTLAIRFKAMRARSSWVAVASAPPSGGAATIHQQVAGQQVAGIDERWGLPSIPMSRGLSGDFAVQPEFHPDRLKQFLGGGRWGEVIGPRLTPERFADHAAAQRDLDQVTARLRPYLADYLNYWTARLPEDAGYKNAEAWDGLYNAFGGMNVELTQAALDRFAQRVKLAVGLVPAGVVTDEAFGEAAVQATLDRFTASGDQQRQQVLTAVKQMQDQLKEFEQPNAAIEAIRKMKPIDFVGDFGLDYFYYEQGSGSDAPVGYWRDCLFNAVSLLADESEKRGVAAREAFDEQFSRFPLVAGPRDKALSRDELTQAASLMGVLLSGVNSDRYAGGTIGASREDLVLGGDSQRYGMLSDELETIRDGEDLGGLEAHYRKIGVIADALSAGVRVVLLRPGREMAGKPPEIDPPAGAGGPARLQLISNHFPVIKLQDRELDSSSGASPDTTGPAIRMPGEALKLAFNVQTMDRDAAPDPFEANWPVIDAMLRHPDAVQVTTSGEQTVYWTPLLIRVEGAGVPAELVGTYYYWIGFGFDTELGLPHPKDWPQPGQE